MRDRPYPRKQSEVRSLDVGEPGRRLIAAGIALSPRVENHQPEGTRRGRRARADVLARLVIGGYNADRRILRFKPAHPPRPLAGTIRQRARQPRITWAPTQVAA
jgi:hypothetical protein